MGYAGQVLPIPAGVDGLYGVRRIPITGLLRGRNLTLENNMWEKWGGATNQNGTALASDILALHDWWSDLSTQRTIAVLDTGAVRRDTGDWTFGTAVTLGTALTLANIPPHLVTGGQETPSRNKKLFCFTGQQTPQVGSGDFTTMANIATPSSAWSGANQPAGGVIHEGRLFVWVGHTLYWSTTADHENFTGAGSGSLPIYPGEGIEIRCAISLRKMLVLFKFPRGIYIFDTSDSTPGNWRADPQSRAVGSPGPYTALAIPNDVLFLDRECNLHLLSATSVLRDATSSNISAPKLGLFTREQFDPSRSPYAHLGWYSDKSQAIVCLSALGAAVNNRIILVDFNNPQVGPRFTYSDRDTPQSLMMRDTAGVAIPYIGTDDGFVQRLDRSARNKNAAAYTGQFQIDHTDIGELAGWAGRPSLFDYLEFEFEGVGAYNLSVNCYVDGELRTATPITYSMTGSGVALGVFVLGVDRLAELAPAKARRRLFWRGTYFSFEGLNSGVDETFRIRKAFLGVRRAG